MKAFLAAAVALAAGAVRWFKAEAGARSRQYTFGTNFFSDVVTNLNAAPPVRVKVNRLHGRIRFALGLWAANATAPQIADILYFVRLPKGVRILGHLSQLSFNAGTAASTMNLGDNASAARHLAATAINAAGVAVPDAVTKNLGVTPFETTDDTRDGTGLGSATNDCDLRGTVAGAVVAVTQNLALYMAYVQD